MAGLTKPAPPAYRAPRRTIDASYSKAAAGVSGGNNFSFCVTGHGSEAGIDSTLRAARSSQTNKPRQNVKLPGYTGKSKSNEVDEVTLLREKKINGRKVPGYQGYTPRAFEKFGASYSKITHEGSLQHRMSSSTPQRSNLTASLAKKQTLTAPQPKINPPTPLEIHRQRVTQNERPQTSQPNLARDPGFISGYTGHRPYMREALSTGRSFHNGAMASRTMQREDAARTGVSGPSKVTPTSIRPHTAPAKPAFIPGYSGHLTQTRESFGLSFGQQSFNFKEF